MPLDKETLSGKRAGEILEEILVEPLNIAVDGIMRHEITPGVDLLLFERDKGVLVDLFKAALGLRHVPECLAENEGFILHFLWALPA